LDIARAKEYPDYRYADNYKLFGWMEDMLYTYLTSFRRPALAPGESLWFVSKGIDYSFEIIFNGEVVHTQEGMFTPVEIDLTERLKDDNLLQVVVIPAPKKHPSPEDRTQASHVCKPPVSYTWDWHPRLVPSGIWDDTFLEVRHRSRIVDVRMDYTLSDDFSNADLRVGVDVAGAEGMNFHWRLLDAHGNVAAETSGSATPEPVIEHTLRNPHLWWCHDHGTPYLYTSEFVLEDGDGRELDRRQQQVGFRRVRLVMNEGAWDEPKGFPKSRSAAPAQIELNGRRVFAKGSNWVCPELFPGTVTEERYRELVEMAVSANFNILRLWGGCGPAKDSFYEICDRMGVLVWSEFPLACNKYPDDEHYLSILRQEAVSIIERLRRHPCIAIWSGGNELFNNWSGMDDQSLPLRLLGSLCYELDRNTPFIPTSPLNGMGHGHYVFRSEGREVFEAMNNSHFTAYPEFGIPGISPREVLEACIPPEELFPARPGTAWESHHAFGAWDGAVKTWLCPDLLEEYMGPAHDLDELIAQSSYLQSIGYKAVFEEARRQKPYCSMALNWCFNEPWPAAANNSLVAYPAVPKPALQAVAASCRPVCTSARLGKLVWSEGEYFEAELWLLNDTHKEVESMKITAVLECGSRSENVLEWDCSGAAPETNTAGPTARIRLPLWDEDRFTLHLRVEGRPQYDSSYELLYRRARQKREGTAAMNVTG
jgi:beta-mannosidase